MAKVSCPKTHTCNVLGTRPSNLSFVVADYNMTFHFEYDRYSRFRWFWSGQVSIWEHVFIRLLSWSLENEIRFFKILFFLIQLSPTQTWNKSNYWRSKLILKVNLIKVNFLTHSRTLSLTLSSPDQANTCQLSGWDSPFPNTKFRNFEWNRKKEVL